MNRNVLFMLLLFLNVSNVVGEEVFLSKKIFRHVPFSSQYSEDGALIRSVDFRSVNDLIPQLEMKFKKLLKGQPLQDRNESHITVITPPEGKTGFFPGNVGIDKVLPTDELINMYKAGLQDTSFLIKCVGMQKSDEGNIVFYLVVESSEIQAIRQEVFDRVQAVDATIPFRPVVGYFPHITIGFIGGDVYGVSKGTDTCVSNVLIR